MISIIPLAILSALLYRLGGLGDGGRKKFPFLPSWLFDTKARDFGCPLVCLASVFLLGIKADWWVHILSLGLLFAALTTYFDYLFKFDNYYFHGFVCGLAALPYPIVSAHWLGFKVRCIILAILMGGICQIISNDDWEEYVRGALLVLTLPLLLI